MRIEFASRLVATCAVILSACQRPSAGPEPTLTMPPVPKQVDPLGAFEANRALTADVERFAVRRPPLAESVDIQIRAMLAYVAARGRGEVERESLPSPVAARRGTGPSARDEWIELETDRLGAAALALFPYLNLDTGPAELADAALRALLGRLGRDAVIGKLRERAVESGDLTPALEDGVAYVWVAHLDEAMGDRLLGLFAQWAGSERPPRAVILDLADCELGEPGAAAAILNAFAPGVAAFSVVYRNPKSDQLERRTYRSDKSHATVLSRIPVFAVISENTAGAAEALAYGLRRHRKARLLGAPTAGTGRLMSFFRLPQRRIIGYTAADLYGPDGEPLAGQALLPDACLGPNGLHGMSERTEGAYRAECTDAGRGVDQNTAMQYVRASLESDASDGGSHDVGTSSGLLGSFRTP